MSHEGQPVRAIGNPEPGWFLVQRLYAGGETIPRLVAEREFVTASIYTESGIDDEPVMCAEIDGRAVDPHDLWTMRVYPISEVEYLARRAR
jgi:hypothetical protein